MRNAAKKLAVLLAAAALLAGCAGRGRNARAGALCRPHRHPGPANAGTDGRSSPNHLHNHAGTDGTKPAAEL